MRQPGDFKSDAEFFVFTGVVAFLGSMASIVVYVFFSGLYSDDQKKFPLYVRFIHLTIIQKQTRQRYG